MININGVCKNWVRSKTYLRTHEKSVLWQTAYLNSSGLEVLSGASHPFHQPSQEASETPGGQQGHCRAPGQIQSGLFSTVIIEIAHISDLWLFMPSRNIHPLFRNTLAFLFEKRVN